MPNSLVHLLQLPTPKPDIAIEISSSLFSWRNFATTNLRYKFLDTKIDIDTIIDIENRK